MNLKKASSIIYFAAMVIGCVLIGCISLITVSGLTGWYIRLGVQIALFVLAGFVHLSLSRKSFAVVFSADNSGGLKHTVLLSVTMMIALALFYMLWNTGLLSSTLACGAAFILPYVSASLYKVFEEIPALNYKPWYKNDKLIEYKSFVFLASIPVSIKLRPNVLDKTFSSYNITVPAQMELGKVFHYFLVQQQAEESVIETKDELDRPVGWLFYIERNFGFQHVPLDPNLNLWKNQVKPGNVILAKRYSGAPERTSFEYPQQNQRLYEYRRKA